MKHFRRFARGYKNKEIANNVKIFKNNQDKYLWKDSFYKAYQKKDYVAAEQIYLSRERYQSGIADVHAAYRLLKQIDHAHTVVVLSSIIFLILSLFVITKCVR